MSETTNNLSIEIDNMLSSAQQFSMFSGEAQRIYGVLTSMLASYEAYEAEVNALKDLKYRAGFSSDIPFGE
jgi:hypothetical protein